MTSCACGLLDHNPFAPPEQHARFCPEHVANRLLSRRTPHALRDGSLADQLMRERYIFGERLQRLQRLQFRPIMNLRTPYIAALKLQGYWPDSTSWTWRRGERVVTMEDIDRMIANPLVTFEGFVRSIR